ncbi:MAG: hypothetical protein L6R41_001919 [Letrouitia leprolyta]|nr:MAG: hypothetical protein L6R41_001919 [Letrouitia leprolyta]
MIKGITSSAQKESANLTDIARQDRRDSKMIKVLSFIVVMYVPATLVASIFSSDLVRLQQKDLNNASKGEHLIVSPQIWIYLVISGSLTLLTLMILLLQKVR